MCARPAAKPSASSPPRPSTCCAASSPASSLSPPLPPPRRGEDAPPGQPIAAPTCCCFVALWRQLGACLLCFEDQLLLQFAKSILWLYHIAAYLISLAGTYASLVSYWLLHHADTSGMVVTLVRICRVCWQECAALVNLKFCSLSVGLCGSLSMNLWWI